MKLHLLCLQLIHPGFEIMFNLEKPFKLMNDESGFPLEDTCHPPPNFFHLIFSPSSTICLNQTLDMNTIQSM